MTDIDAIVIKNVAKEAGSLNEASKLLGIARSSLKRKMQSLGLDAEFNRLCEKGFCKCNAKLNKKDITKALRECGSITRAADSLNVGRKTLKKHMEAHGIGKPIVKKKPRSIVEKETLSKPTPRRIRLRHEEDEALKEELASAVRERDIVPPSKEELSTSFWNDLEGRLQKLHEGRSETPVQTPPEESSSKEDLKPLLIRLTKVMLDIYEED